MRPALLDGHGCSLDLPLTFDGARSRDYSQPLTANRYAADIDLRAFGTHLTAGKLERPQHRHHALDAAHRLEMSQRMCLSALLANACDDRPFDSANHMRVIGQRLDHLHDVLDLGLIGMRLHYNNHIDSSGFRSVAWGRPDADGGCCATV